MRYRFLLLRISFFFLLACSDNELRERGYPKINTLPVVDIKESGALFQAEIDYPDLSEIIDHGFVWGKEDDLSIEKSEFVTLGKLQGTFFEKEINSGFEAKLTYWTRSYVKTGKKTIYGNAVKFLSLGSSRPIIIKAFPNVGTVGDTITIQGKYFGSKKEHVVIKFNSTQAVTLSCNDSILKTIVPFLVIPEAKVTVSVFDIISNEVTFLPRQPIITDFFPKTISDPSQILTIQGQYFNLNSSLNKVSIGSELLPASAIVSTSLTEIKVRLQNLFPPNIGRMELVKIMVQVGGQTGTSSESLKLAYKAAWTKLADFPGNSRTEALSFTINGKGYFGFGKNGQILLNDLWEYDPTQDLWTKKSDFPGPKREGSTCLSVGSKAYVGLGIYRGFPSYTDTPLNDWWEYNPATDSWTQKSDFPTPYRSGAFAFELGGKAFIGGGYDNFGQYSRMFWSFDPASSEWSLKALLPADMSVNSPTYSFQNKGYFYSSSSARNYEHVYDPDLDWWTSRQIFRVLPTSVSSPQFNNYLQFNDYLVFSGGATYNLYKIQPGGSLSETRWESLPYYKERLGSSGFAINNLGYVGLGLDVNTKSYVNDFWLFDPSLLP